MDFWSNLRAPATIYHISSGSISAKRNLNFFLHAEQFYCCSGYEKFNVNIACICANFMFNALQSTNMFYGTASDSRNFKTLLRFFTVGFGRGDFVRSSKLTLIESSRAEQLLNSFNWIFHPELIYCTKSSTTKFIDKQTRLKFNWIIH